MKVDKDIYVLVQFEGNIQTIDGNEFQKYTKEKLYLMLEADVLYFESSGVVKNKVHISETPFAKKIYNGQDLNGKTLVIDRSGGFGDLMIIASIAQYLKSLYDCKITLSCRQRFMTAAQRMGFDYVIQSPLNSEILNQYDYLGKIYGWVEGNENKESVYISMHEQYCNALGVNFEEYKKFNCFSFYEPTQKDIIMAQDIFSEIKGWEPHCGNIGIQVAPSSSQRAVPISKLVTISESLANYGYNVWLLSEADVQSTHNNIFVVNNRDFVQVAGFVTQLDLIISSDSVYPHLCNALGKKCVSIYGAFPAETRMGFYKTVIGVEDSNPRLCKYCLRHHGRECHRLFRDGNYGSFPECLMGINSGDLFVLALNMLQRDNVITSPKGNMFLYSTDDENLEKLTGIKKKVS